MNSMKHVIIIIFTVCITVGIVLSWYHDKKTKKTIFIEEISEMKSERDSLFSLADNVVNKLVQEKEINQSQIDELNKKVAKGEITLSQKEKAIKEIVKSNEEKVKKLDVLPKEVVMMTTPDGRIDELKKENYYLKSNLERLYNRNEELSMEINSMRSKMLSYDSVIVIKDSIILTSKKPKKRFKIW